MLIIRQTAPGTWELCRGDTVVAQFVHDDDRVAYSSAMSMLATMLSAMSIDERATLATNGVLPETWVSDLCFSDETGDGRNFSTCTWTSRDPSTSVVPLMLQTVTEFGHFGAELAGYFEAIDNLGAGTNPTGRGRFYDSEVGVQFRDMLLEGRRFGISVDPGAVAVEEECLDVDDDGWCVAWQLNFIEYEIIGATGTPFPGFATAAIWLDGAPAEAADDDGEEAVAAAGAHADGGPACCASCATARRASAPVVRVLEGRGPRQAYTLVAGGAAQDQLIRPPRGLFSAPSFDRITALRIDDPDDGGWVRGHLAPWGQCHTGYLNRCVETPRSLSGYAQFRTGYVVTLEGDEVATGPLTIGTGHADRTLSFRGAVDHYDNTGTAVADVIAGEDDHGVWVSGVLRPGVTAEQVRTLRASALSGDWRPMGAGLELVAALAVNSPGFPIARIDENGKVQALVAAGALAVVAQDDPDHDRFAHLERRLADAERALAAPHRTRLQTMRREALRARLAGRR